MQISLCYKIYDEIKSIFRGFVSQSGKSISLISGNKLKEKDIVLAKFFDISL